MQRRLPDVDVALIASDPVGAGLPHLTRLAQLVLACAVQSDRSDDYVAVVMDLTEAHQEVLMQLVSAVLPASEAGADEGVAQAVCAPTPEERGAPAPASPQGRGAASKRPRPSNASPAPMDAQVAGGGVAIADGPSSSLWGAWRPETQHPSRR